MCVRVSARIPSRTFLSARTEITTASCPALSFSIDCWPPGNAVPSPRSRLHLAFAGAATLTYDWSITWVTANPDGLYERPVISINGEWPIPVLNSTKGDRVIANVYNALGNETTSVHWHGFYMNGTNNMDGPPAVTQCEIPPGSSFTYNFTVEQTGTYWYHSHTRGQFPDGFRQILTINDPEDPYKDQYDEELVVTLSDWYHQQMADMLKGFISVYNPTGAEPVPQSALMNDTRDLRVPVQPGRTYLLHLVNDGALASHYFWIQGHSMKIVEVDGVWTEPADAEMIYLASAQRYSVLVTMKDDASQNYPMTSSMDTDLFDTVPRGLNQNVTGWLVYGGAATGVPARAVDKYDAFDDFDLIPHDGAKRLAPADHTIELDMKMASLGDGANYAFFNDISYVMPKVPTLYSVLTTGPAATDPVIYGHDTNPFILQKGEVVDIILNNLDTGKHPFHLHGHAFQVLDRPRANSGRYNASNHAAFPAVPVRRDTLVVYPLSNFHIRFEANNPGVWLFHCHIEWHMDSGLVATMIEAPLDVQNSLTIPEDHYQVCRASNTQYAGNAAGHTQNVYNLKGANTMVAPLPDGFTAGGIVALVFSCIAGVLGLASIVWYGMAPMTSPSA